MARKQAVEPAPATGDAPASEPRAVTSADEVGPEPTPEPTPEREPEPPAEPTPEPEPTREPARGGRRYRHRELKLADGGRLVLRTDGTIARFDDAGTRTVSWTTDDPEWPGYAIRFGLHPEPGTVAPNGSGVRGTRPPS